MNGSCTHDVEHVAMCYYMTQAEKVRQQWFIDAIGVNRICSALILNNGCIYIDNS